MPTDPRHRPLTTLDLMLSLPLLALALVAVTPLVNRVATPRVEVAATIRAAVPPAQARADVTSYVESLDSVKTIEVIRNDPALAALPARPTLADLQEDVAGRLRIAAIPRTKLLCFALRSADPARGAATVNATAHTFLRTKRPGQYTLVAPATPPTTPPSHPILRFIAAYAVLIPILALTALMTVRWLRGGLLDRRAQAYFYED